MLRFLLSFLLLLLLSSTGMKAQEATASVPFDTLGQEMKRRLDAITTDELLQRSQLGLYVYDLTADRPLYTYGHRQRMRPASTMKVITAIVALDKLGGDYRYHTRFYTTAPLDSIVRGHLTRDDSCGRGTRRVVRRDRCAKGDGAKIHGDYCAAAARGAAVCECDCSVRSWAAARPRDRHTRASLGVVDLEARPGPAAAHGRRSHTLLPRRPRGGLRARPSRNRGAAQQFCT